MTLTRSHATGAQRPRGPQLCAASRVPRQTQVDSAAFPGNALLPTGRQRTRRRRARCFLDHDSTHTCHAYAPCPEDTYHTLCESAETSECGNRPSSCCSVSQLNSLLYQLHTVSFLLSPRIWAYFCRVLVQFQFSRPRDIDPQRSLRFWIFCILSTNVPSIYNHAAKSPAAGRSLILDFVGVGMLWLASLVCPHRSQGGFLHRQRPLEDLPFVI